MVAFTMGLDRFLIDPTSLSPCLPRPNPLKAPLLAVRGALIHRLPGTDTWGVFVKRNR